MTGLYVPVGDYVAADGSQGPYTDGFWIDQENVTNALFTRFVQATLYRTDAESARWGWVWFDGPEFVRVNGADWQHPKGPGSDIVGRDDSMVVHISWDDATAYCKWAGRGLVTGKEWAKAAALLAGAGIDLPAPWYGRSTMIRSNIDGFRCVAAP